MYVYVYIYVCMYTCIYIYMYVCIRIYKCMYVYVHIYMYVCIYICMYVYVYIYMYVCIRIYICMYTYIYMWQVCPTFSPRLAASLLLGQLRVAFFQLLRAWKRGREHPHDSAMSGYSRLRGQSNISTEDYKQARCLLMFVGILCLMVKVSVT